ncbi:hypothetical protein AVEN_73976-1 [Araneus ventricosus]|uniref:Uncharacterized protein n=1 Tax=Araneus ventricosus TaxID=182803 RepID=A0A4Y2L381_ARAVE|nr:hypothetical protein AVEN_73976-1 [Araneus ventricosus]
MTLCLKGRGYARGQISVARGLQLWSDDELKSFFQLESLGIYDSGVSDNREETELMMQRFEGVLELLKGVTSQIFCGSRNLIRSYWLATLL